ncbi:iron siderophore-binding protein [Calothrix sp. HK-06]|nr:iron siderophore-binding protein [Calothrix sp. HK-06]
MGLAIVLVTGCYQLGNYNSHYLNENKEISECRKVQHILGESCVPIKPQRIIVTDQESLEIAVALGFQPVGAVKANIVGSKERILAKKIENITYLGKESQPNLEKMVKLQPDLILGLGIDGQGYRLYSKIAPTLTFDFNHAAWKKDLRLIAQALNRIEQADKLLFQYENKVKGIQELFKNKLKNTDISVSRFYAGWNFTQFQTPLSFSGSILQEIGFAVPKQQNQLLKQKYSDGTYVTVSKEKMELIDADILFVALDPGSEKNFNKYRNNPLWQTLHVVKNQRVYTVDSGHWIFGSILSANAILDDLLQVLLKKPGI